MSSFFGVVCVNQKTAYEVRISDWSSDVCSSDLDLLARRFLLGEQRCHLSSEGDDIWVLLGVLRQKLAKRSLDLDDAALGVVRRTGIEKVGRNRLRDVGQQIGRAHV